jgi:hypothetical protein
MFEIIFKLGDLGVKKDESTARVKPSRPRSVDGRRGRQCQYPPSDRN